MLHQYIDRDSGNPVTEKLFADPIIRWLYSDLREKAPLVFKALTGPEASSLLGFINYETLIGSRISGNYKLLKDLSVKESEFLEPLSALDTPKKIFERKIKYWECRPVPENPHSILSPSDSKAIVGSLRETSLLFLKEKFFHFEELLSPKKKNWLRKFKDGDFSIFRLTPEEYHYNHSPVSGTVVDFYEIQGDCHSCNPTAIANLITPFSKNRRVVTVIDTDVPGGSRVGLVAFVEVVAMMIGEIEQCYSDTRYENPQRIKHGLFMKKGQPKSLFRPGSSTVVLFFQVGRIKFASEIISNMENKNAVSRFTLNFEKPLVETSVRVRSYLGAPS